MRQTILVLIVMLLQLLWIAEIRSEENIRKVAIWNMKWLGINSGNQLDPVESVPLYADYLLRTEATLFALQEIGATHSVSGVPKCHYMDLIIAHLNAAIANPDEQWTYVIDMVNKSQRLGFLFKKDLWIITNVRNINPGNSYQHIRKPFVADVQASGDNAKLQFTFIDVHFKAFPDKKDREKRRKNIRQLAQWIERETLDDDVLIGGDTNIYKEDTRIEKGIEDIDYIKLFDREATSIHNDALGQRFDRFYCSPGLHHEIEAAKNVVGSTIYIDVIKDNAELLWYDRTISDHYPVVINIDVSRERN